MGNSNCGCGCSSKEGKENEEVRFTEVKKEIVDQEDVDDDDEFRIRPMEPSRTSGFRQLSHPSLL